MTHMIVRHGVEDFDRWYAVFKSHAGAQAGSGLRPRMVLRDAEDPHVVVMWFEIDSVEAAEAFMATPEAAEAGSEAGVVGEAQVWYLEDRA